MLITVGPPNSVTRFWKKSDATWSANEIASRNMLRNIPALFAPDPPSDGGPAPENQPAPAPVPANAPPAAVGVVNGKTERELQLEKDLETERVARKKAETDASYSADEARRLKEAQDNPPKKRRGGWVFPDEEEE